MTSRGAEEERKRCECIESCIPIRPPFHRICFLGLLQVPINRIEEKKQKIKR